MLNAGRNQGFLYSFATTFGKPMAVKKATEYGAGYKPNFRLYSPLPFLFTAKNLIGYPLDHAIHQDTARRRFEFHLPDCDMTGHLPYSGRCPFLLYKLVCICHPERPGIWTPNQRAALDPKGLAGVRRFGSIILVSLRNCAGGEGKGKCKGNMNTYERVYWIMNFVFALAGMEWTKGANNVSRPDNSQIGAVH